jgi:hypothetical protein
LCQKIAIVDDNIVVAWGNDPRAAIDFISELKDCCKRERFDTDRFKEYLKSQPKYTWDSLSLTGFVVDTNGDWVSFGCGCREIQSPSLGKIFVLGRGSALMKKHLMGNAESTVIRGADGNLAFEALIYGMSIAGNFLTMEQFACESLDQMFGGGYEIATLSYDNFVKPGGLYAFWRGTVNENDNSVSLGRFPFAAFRYKYFGDLLVVRGVRIDQETGAAQPTESVFPIRPADRYLTAEETANPPLPEFNDSATCNFVQMILPNNRMKISTFLGNQTNALDFREQHGQVIQLAVSQELRETISKFVATKYGKVQW